MDHLHLIDASGLLYAGYYGSEERLDSRGKPTNMINAWAWWLNNWLVRNTGHTATMTHMAAVFDRGGKTFRHDLLPEYKSGRKERPIEMIQQIAACRQACKVFGIHVIDNEGTEADDLIASMAHKFPLRGGKAGVTILSHDKDLIQLVRLGCNLVRPDRIERPEVTIESSNRKEIGAIMGFEGEIHAAKIPDLQGLTGDTVDKIPGCPGIGIKTAGNLIKHFQDLETIYAFIDKEKVEKKHEGILTERQKNLIRDNKEQVFLSRQLARLRTDLPIPNFDDLTYSKPDWQRLGNWLDKHELSEVKSSAINWVPEI